MKKGRCIVLLILVILVEVVMAQSPRHTQRNIRTIPIDSMLMSDPFILADPVTRMYYMTGSGGMLWKSKDLNMWTGPYNVVAVDTNSWMGKNPAIWAAELHFYKGKYYYFATFTNKGVIIDTVKKNAIERRASHILVSDKPDGPYIPMKDSIYLPANKPTLDGTFWIDKDGKPYMIFCHEWLQNWNGTVEKIELKPDLSGSIGESKLLFLSSDSPWSKEYDENRNIIPNKVTDGPFLFRTQTGKLGMLWTSWVFKDYTQGVAYSESGTLVGQWIQEKEPITPPNYGHGMLFHTFEGKLLMSVHSHKENKNGRYIRTPQLLEVDDSGDKLILKNKELASGRKINLDKGWRSHLGSTSNAEQASYNDSKWRALDLPHDWSIEPVPVAKEGITLGPFSRMSDGGVDTGQTLGGEGWYRTEFTIAKEDADKRLLLYFEGIYNQSEVWINGTKVHYNPYGYTSFRLDISKYCNAPGTSNSLVVKAVNAGKNSRWYSGSGIYRHVWLIKTDKVYLDEWDTFVNASELKEKEAVIKLNTILHNVADKDSRAKLNIKIFSPTGNEVYSTTQNVHISASGDEPVSISFNLKKPELWSIDTPVLYQAEISVLSDSGETDKITIPFGIRTIAFSAEKGFLLNGKPVKLKGGCLHHDNGLLGAAAIDRAEERKVELMKANGYNAVRCAHNLPSEYFLQACDRLGLLVIDEVFDQWQEAKRPQDYHQFFDEWSEYDMTTMVRRDRNHPSIILWSIGNEIAERADAVGEIIAKRLITTIKNLDDSRFTTAAVNNFWDRRHFTWAKDSERAFRNLDVAGYNYMWQEYEKDHQKFPDRIMFGTESVPKEAAQNWNLVEKHPYIIGDFVWTSVDYLGEAGLAHTLELAPGERNPQFMDWPWYNAWCGDIDLCGDKKPQSYYRDILWRRTAISLAVQPPVAEGKREDINYWGWKNELLSWNWKGFEGQMMKVNIYSRSPKVRLYLNNKLIGEKEVNQENYTSSFDVVYEPGVLKAVNVIKNKETLSAELKTTAEPAAIRLTADRTSIKADKNDLSYIKIEIVDKEGNLVPDTNLAVNIKCTGNGSVIAAGNASYDDMKSFRSFNPNTFRGKAMAIVQPNENKGEINLTVSATGLDDASITLKVY